MNMRAHYFNAFPWHFLAKNGQKNKKSGLAGQKGIKVALRKAHSIATGGMAIFMDSGRD